jgi:hypothetical protein
MAGRRARAIRRNADGRGRGTNRRVRDEVTEPPFQIIAAGVCAQGTSPGQYAPNTVACKALNGGTGVWQVTVDDLSVARGRCVLILSPGSAANIAEGISFGQSGQQGRDFLFTIYRNDTGAVVDVEAQFIVVKWPA